MDDLWHFARKVALVAGAAIMVLVAWLLVDVLLVIFASVLFAVFLTGPAILLARHTPLPRTAALAIVIVALAILIGLGVWFTGREIVSQIDQLRESLTTAWEDWQARAKEHAWGRMLFDSDTAKQVARGRSHIIDGVTGVLSGVVSGIGAVVVVIALGIYIAVDPGLYKHGMLRLFPPASRPRVRQILEALWVSLNGWLIGRFISMLIIGLGTGIGLWLLGIPMALALGLLAFSVTFIPYIGPILSAVPAVLVASSMGSSQLMWVLALYGGLQFLETYLLTPLIEHRTVKVPPALSIGAQLAGGVLFGPVGLLLATPIAAVLMVLVQMLYVEDTLHERIKTPEEKA